MFHKALITELYTNSYNGSVQTYHVLQLQIDKVLLQFVNVSETNETQVKKTCSAFLCPVIHYQTLRTAFQTLTENLELKEVLESANFIIKH